MTMRLNHENGLSCLVLECGLPRLNLTRCVGSLANYADLIRFENGRQPQRSPLRWGIFLRLADPALACILVHRL